MVRNNTTPSQQSRDTSRAATDTRHTHENQQDLRRRAMQHGTPRNETRDDGGQCRDDSGSSAPAPTPPDQERGDGKRPYKRAGH